MITLLVALGVLGVLSGLTLLVLRKLRLLHKSLLLLFGLALAVHLASALFIHYADFYPFGGGQGDAPRYHKAALAISQDFDSGIFSTTLMWKHLQRNAITNQWYPAFVGALYALTLPEKLVGVMPSVWFAALAVLLVFSIAKELGASEKTSFAAGLAAALYPSFLYFGSMLLRESFVAFLFLAVLWLALRLLKHFSWSVFLLFYVALSVLFHFRFYVGFAALFAFLLSWLFIFGKNWREKAKYGLPVAFLLGLIPLFFGHGYYGVKTIPSFVDIEHIKIYREAAYSRFPALQPQSVPGTQSPSELQPAPGTEPVSGPKPVPRGRGSTQVVNSGFESPSTFLKNSAVAFSFVALGPFPWHFQQPRHFFVLLETIPWYGLLFFMARGAWRKRKQWKGFLPVFLFSLGVLGLISVFLASNFGVYMRIRIPAFLTLFALLPFGLEQLTKGKIWHIKTLMSPSFLFLLLAFFFFPATASAYLDPGTGSMVVQVIIATVAGVLYALKIYWRRIFGIFRRKRNGRDQAEQ